MEATVSLFKTMKQAEVFDAQMERKVETLLAVQSAQINLRNWQATGITERQPYMQTRSTHVAAIGPVQSWNAHRIQGKGIPNQLALGGWPKKLPGDRLPEAADCYGQCVTIWPKPIFHSGSPGSS